MAADTPQHAIRDGEYRLIYVTGNRGLYKMFPDTGQILMFKSAGPGNQGHQAGYAGYGGPPKGIMEIIVTNYNRSTGAGAQSMMGLRHVPSVGWLSFGETVGVDIPRWTSVTSNKFNPDELLVLGTETWGLNISPTRINGSGPTIQLYAGPTLDQAAIWYSPDCGDNWVPFTNITLNMPASISPREGATHIQLRIHKIQWDHIVNGRWAAMGIATDLYAADGYSHYSDAAVLIVGTRDGTAHMWVRPFPNMLINNSVWGPPNWPYFGTWGFTWSWVDPDPDTGFHKIVFGATIRAGSMYQYVLAETSIPGPTGTSWTPAYTVNVDPDGIHGPKGLAVPGFDPMDHRRGTMEVYHILNSGQNTAVSSAGAAGDIGGHMLWQQNYMEPTPGFNNNRWDFFIPGVQLGGDVVAAADALYIGGRSATSPGIGGIFRLPYGSTTYDAGTVVEGTEGHHTSGIAVDEQHKTYVVAIDGTRFGEQHFFVFDGETWGYVEHMSGTIMTYGSVAIINRTPFE